MITINRVERTIFNKEYEAQIIREMLKFQSLVNVGQHLLIGNDFVWLFLEHGKKIAEARSFELTDDLADFLVAEGYSSNDLVIHDESEVNVTISITEVIE